MPRSRSRRRASRVTGSVVAGILGAGVAGCGGDQRDAPSDPAPSASPAAAAIVRGEEADRGGSLTLLPRTTVRRHGVRRQEVAAVLGRLAVTANASTLVVGWAGADDPGLQFAVGRRGGRDDLEPLPVPVMTAAGSVPRWASIHLGSDSGGRPLVTYPRCRSGRAQSCDLFAFPLDGRDAAAEQALTQVNTEQGAETEAVTDRGAILAVRERDGELTIDDRAFAGGPGRSTLLLALPGQATRTLTRDGGRELALNLSARRAAMVLDPENTENDEGVCGTRHVRMLDFTGEIKRDREVTCGLAGQSPSTPQITPDRELRFGIMLLADEGTSSAYRWLPREERPTELPLRTQFVVDWLPTSAAGGWAILGASAADCRGLWDGEPSAPCQLVRFTGVDPR